MPWRFVIFEEGSIMLLLQVHMVTELLRDWLWQLFDEAVMSRLPLPDYSIKDQRERIGFSYYYKPSQKRYIWLLVQWAWTPVNKGLHPPKTGIWLNSKSEQPIDVKLGLKIRANSSVWLDFRGEKSPSVEQEQSPPFDFSLLASWAELISLKKSLLLLLFWALK